MGPYDGGRSDCNVEMQLVTVLAQFIYLMN